MSHVSRAVLSLSKGFTFCASVCILVAIVSLPLAMQPTSSAALPPISSPTPTTEPTPTSTPVPASPSVPPTGGLIELRAQFPQAWPWASVHWQELWTVVQWQGQAGDWYDVEGWQGELDHITVGAEGEIEGQKRWWVARSDLGKGPFRWAAYSGRAGRLLARSESFYLPGSSGATRQVEIIPAVP